ncbi:MAG: YCF48-related protein, partial [Ignavibacteria bacterium]|nr:YCF48-related protein [Ignavibacteria bacterium]
WAVGSSGIILHTTNAGYNWHSQNSGVSSNLISICFSSDNIGTIVGSDGLILRTTNSGVSWFTQSSGTTKILFDISMIDENNITIVGDGGTILNTVDGGISWTKVESGTEVYLQSIATRNSIQLIVGDYGTILRRTLSDTSSISLEDIPDNFMLSQNYPNPFNPTTTIEYQLPSAGHVLLKVYDILGREIVTLINENKYAGNYKVTFDGKKFVSGVYFYTINANKYSKTKKMILMK